MTKTLRIDETVDTAREKFYTVAQVADIFLVTRRTIYRWIKIGMLHAVQSMRFGTYRIPESEINRVKQQYS